jgi:hypothetical protein
MDVADLLAAWRAAQAVLEGTEPSSEEHRAADEACREAANAYQRHVAEHADMARELGARR